MINPKDLYEYKKQEKWSFADRISKWEVWERSRLYKQYWKLIESDIELLLHEFIINRWEDKEQVKNIKIWAYMFYNFIKACYWQENKQKVLEEMKAKNSPLAKQ